MEFLNLYHFLNEADNHENIDIELKSSHGDFYDILK